METFEEFCVGRNRTNYPRTDKFPDGYVGVMIYKEDYEKLIQSCTVQKSEGEIKTFLIVESTMNGTVTMNTNITGLKANSFREAILKLKEKLVSLNAKIITANEFHFIYSIDGHFPLIGRLENKELKFYELTTSNHSTK